MMNRIGYIACLLTFLLLAGCASSGTTPGTDSDEAEPDESAPISAADTYDEDTVLFEAGNFFGEGAKGLADVLNRTFSEQGRPNGYITGEEAAAAIGIGLRYGHGTLHLKNGATKKVYWRGPSLGFDFGANASKAFILIYDLPALGAIFQRYPGVEGSLYFVGGVGVNYNESGGIRLAPVRFGVGWRQGVNLGYLHFSAKKSWVPF